MVTRPRLNDAFFDQSGRFTLMAGPCQLEDRDHAFMMAKALKDIAARQGVPFVYKTSFDKANRTSLGGKRGLGLENALAVFQALRDELDVPIVTDVHLPQQCALVAPHVDMLQIPAFLCRQTDLLLAAAETGLPIMVKKGQFLAPWDMAHVAAKLTQSGCDPRWVMLCDRGTSFGYNTLVTDFRGLPQMAQMGHPVVFDATHSVQQPGGQGASSGGKREFVPVLARAAVAVGISGLFMEVHEDPDNAPSDGPNMVPLAQFEALLENLVAFDRVAKGV